MVRAKGVLSPSECSEIAGRRDNQFGYPLMPCANNLSQDVI